MNLRHIDTVVDTVERNPLRYAKYLALVSAERERAICVCRPVPAVALELRRVCFVVYPDLGLVEFLERTTT